MRLIGTLPTEADSKRFCDYLLTRGAPAHFEPGQNDWQIWIENDDLIEAGKAELAHFIAVPSDPRYDAAAQAKAVRIAAEKAALRRRKNFTDVRTANFTGGQTIPVTVTIIFISVVVAALMKFGTTGTLQHVDGLPVRLWHALLFDDFTQYSEDYSPGRFLMFDSIRHGQIWRLVTPIFIHYGPLHLIFNMMWMLDLGRRIETIKGGIRLVILILVFAVLTNIADSLWITLTENYGNTGGMSGVVAGLFGYAWMCGHFRPYERIGVTQYETGLMLGWLVICSLGIVGPIANAAHWGGLLSGMAIGAAPSLMKRRS